ncbi:dgd1 suppressor 1 [Artemisia annua]|uniref:Dgd1 suppressor 1 n=1 Tax=Artemisia annua TaxID=35608 RepID=A0A2U1PFI1_ARTAN|nr:dgd1 suppressor 1 [Artemisia annua]
MSTLSKYRKPRKITQHWMRYTFGAIGISLFSVWLIRSGIVDNWVLGVKSIFSQEQALTAARDELLETMRNMQKEETEQLQLTSNLLHSFLLDFSERIKGEKSSSNVSDRKILEMATTSFEEQLRHPIRNFIWGELPLLLQIQILKKTHDIEVSMGKLHHQMLMDYETTNAILPSLPTIFISFGVLMISRTWVKQTKAKGRSARAKRRLLLNELEKRIVELQNLSLSSVLFEVSNPLVLFGNPNLNCNYKEIFIYVLMLYKRVRDDITLFGDTGLATSDKLTITSRLKETYQCLLPSMCEERIRRTIVEDYAAWSRELPQKKLSSESQLSSQLQSSSQSHRDIISQYVLPSRGARMQVQAGGVSSSGDE